MIATRVALLGLLSSIPAFAAHAQFLTACNRICIGDVGCGQACDEPNSFTTVHEWKVKKPGTLELDGTKFSVRWNDVALTFELWYGEKMLQAGELNALESTGANRARDLQTAGVPLQ